MKRDVIGIILTKTLGVVIIVILILSIQILGLILSLDLPLLFRSQSKVNTQKMPEVVFAPYDGRDEEFIYPCDYSRCNEAEKKRWRQEIYEGVWNPTIWFDDDNVIELCNALYKGRTDQAEEIILKKGVDLNYKGKDGMTILLWSIFCDFEQIELILSNGANPDFIIESDYSLAITYPKEDFKSRSFFGLLLYLSYKEEADDSSHLLSELYKLVLKYGADPNYNNQGWYVKYGTSDKTHNQNSICRSLIASGLDIQGRKSNGDPYIPAPYIPAITYTNHGMPIPDEEVGLFPYLLKCGYFCDVNTQGGCERAEKFSSIVGNNRDRALLNTQNDVDSALAANPFDFTAIQKEKRNRKLLELNNAITMGAIRVLSSQGVIKCNISNPESPKPSE